MESSQRYIRNRTKVWGGRGRDGDDSYSISKFAHHGHGPGTLILRTIPSIQFEIFTRPSAGIFFKQTPRFIYEPKRCQSRPPAVRLPGPTRLKSLFRADDDQFPYMAGMPICPMSLLVHVGAQSSGTVTRIRYPVGLFNIEGRACPHGYSW